MSVLNSWTGGLVLFLALAGGLRAEVTVSQSNAPEARIDSGLMHLFGVERSSMTDAVGRLDAVAPRAETAAQDADDADGEIAYSRAWLASQPEPATGAELQCLAQAVYFEARGESLKGQAAVAEVVLNRVDDPKFPRTICGVVHQGGRGGCQFSWTCDGRSDRVANAAAFSEAKKLAAALMQGAPRQLTDGATYFHTPAVKPSWSRKFYRTAQIGSHIFYKSSMRTASR